MRELICYGRKEKIKDIFLEIYCKKEMIKLNI